MMPPPPLPQQAEKDRSHLRTLLICHYVAAALNLGWLGFLWLHYKLMSGVFANPKMWEKAKEQPPFDPQEFMDIFKWFYLLMAVVMLAYSLLTFLSGFFLGQRKNRLFSMIASAFNCLSFPFGTLLGIFTLIVLSRPSVQRLYEAEKE